MAAFGGGGNPFGGGGGSGSVNPIPVLSLINSAFRIAGIMGAPRRGSSISEQNEAFDILNAMLDSWNTERLIVFHEDRLVFPLVANQQEYTIGPTDADFTATRPVRLDRASTVIQYNGPQPIELPMQIMTYVQWQAIATKNVTSSIPRMVYYDAQYANGHLFYWPLPSEVVQTVLYVWSQLGQFSSPGDNVALPPGYLKALTYNLAAEIANYYPARQKMSAMAYKTAVESKAWVKRVNYIPLDIQVDRALIDNSDVGWNIYTGEWNR